MTLPDLAAFFRPETVCLIGISERPGSAGRRLAENLLDGGYPGKVVGVHPRAESVRGVPCVPSVDDLPSVPDVAVLSLPAAACAATLDALGRRGVRRAVVFASGFAECGTEGADLQAGLRAVAERHDIAVVGPNCMGVVDLASGVSLSFSSALAIRREAEHRPVAVVAQSGAVAALLWQSLRERGCPASTLVSSGNEAVVRGAEIVGWLLQESDVEQVCWYAEGWTVADVRAVAQRAASVEKSVVLVPGGVTSAGRRATAAHTGSTAEGDLDVLLDLASGSAGALRIARTPTEAVDHLIMGGSRLSGAGVVVASSGGMSVLAAEAAERHGVALAPLSETTRGRVAALLPAFGATYNPVDITAELFYQPERVQEIARVITEDPAVGWILLVGALGFPSASKLVSAVTGDLVDAGSDLLVAWEGAGGDLASEVAALGVRFFRDVDEAMAAIGASVDRTTPAALGA